jgi:hypothetical protein
MQIIAENMGILSTLPIKKPLRVYYSLFGGSSNDISKQKLHTTFSSKCKGIINIIVENAKGGHFVVESTDSA